MICRCCSNLANVSFELLGRGKRNGDIGQPNRLFSLDVSTFVRVELAGCTGRGCVKTEVTLGPPEEQQRH